MRRGLTPRMLLASGLLAVIVGVAFAVLLRSIHDVRGSARRASHSLLELAAVATLEKLIVDLETATRGYVITREESFLAPWNVARTAYPRQARALARIADSPYDAARARRILAAGTSYIREYTVPLIAATRRNDPSARSVSRTAEGKRRVDGLRRQFDSYRARDSAIFGARRRTYDATARRATVAGTVGLIGSVVLIVLFAGYLERTIVRPIRRTASMAARLARGDLTARMPVTGVGEVGALQDTFNTMAGSLEASREELRSSRARVVAAADDARRRIERNLHDGAQQRLVALGLELRAAEEMAAPTHTELRGRLSRVVAGLTDVAEELRELSHGIHPAVLSRGGLRPALGALARRSAVPVELDVQIDRRLTDHVEVAAYYVVSEALTNAAKHAQASGVQVEVHDRDVALELAISDDGIGGADPRLGSGLTGLRDRVEALAGTLEIASPVRGGTTLRVTLPIARSG